MLIIGWFLTVSLFLGGFLGCFLPMVPGTPLMLAGALVYQWLVAVPDHRLSAGTLTGLTVLMVLSQIADLVSGMLGASRFGASKYGMWGGVAGVFVGLFLGLPGLIFGPLFGVVLGELYGGKAPQEALRAAWGTLVGSAAGIVARVIFGLAMLVWFIAAVWR